jgi:hypothetical protein
MTQSKAGHVISDGKAGPSSITPHPLEPLAFAVGSPKVIQPLWNRMCKNKSHSGLHVVGVQMHQDTLFQTQKATVLNRNRDCPSEAPANSSSESGGFGSTAGITDVPHDPLEPLAISVGAHAVITDRAVVDEIIQRHSSAGLADGRGLAGQLQAAYIFGISPEEIDAVGASIAVSYSLLPSRVTKQADINETQAAKCPARLRAKHAIDIQIAVIGSLLNRRPDLYWMFESLVGLSDSLGELDAGFSPPLLARTPRSAHAGREDTYQRLVKSFAVVGWAALIRVGVGKGEADRLIVKQLTKGKFLPPKNPDQSAASTRSLLTWRKKYAAGDLPPLILPSRRFLRLFPAGSKADTKRVLELLKVYLDGAKATRDGGGGFRVLRPADLRHLRGSQDEPRPVSIEEFRRKMLAE